MSEADLYKFFSQYDGEADLSDFTPEELSRLLHEKQKEDYKEKYFTYYDENRNPAKSRIGEKTKGRVASSLSFLWKI